jgi:predicted ABC-type ATPase
MTSHRQPICWIIAGPNGAGKTTFALRFLPEVVDCPHFVNADLIAAGLSPLRPESGLMRASRLFLSEIKARITMRAEFAFETTLAGRGHFKLIERLQGDGWRVELIYLALSNVEMSVQRVAERVAHGGHDVSLDVIRRRFPRSLHNLLLEYGPCVDRVRCFLNSAETPQLVFIEQNGARQIMLPEIYARLLIEAGV